MCPRTPGGGGTTKGKIMHVMTTKKKKHAKIINRHW
jgi:hypothetical protein